MGRLDSLPPANLSMEDECRMKGWASLSQMLQLSQSNSENLCLQQLSPLLSLHQGDPWCVSLQAPGFGLLLPAVGRGPAFATCCCLSTAPARGHCFYV